MIVRTWSLCHICMGWGGCALCICMSIRAPEHVFIRGRVGLPWICDMSIKMFAHPATLGAACWTFIFHVFVQHAFQWFSISTGTIHVDWESASFIECHVLGISVPSVSTSACMHSWCKQIVWTQQQGVCYSLVNTQHTLHSCTVSSAQVRSL